MIKLCRNSKIWAGANWQCLFWSSHRTVFLAKLNLFVYFFNFYYILSIKAHPVLFTYVLVCRYVYLLKNTHSMNGAKIMCVCYKLNILSITFFILLLLLPLLSTHPSKFNADINWKCLNFYSYVRIPHCVFRFDFRKYFLFILV